MSPIECTIGVHIVTDDSVERYMIQVFNLQHSMALRRNRARQNTVNFFEQNTDPFAVMYAIFFRQFGTKTEILAGTLQSSTNLRTRAF